MNFLVIFAVIALLIGLNAFFVAAEFSTVSARRARLAQLADEGNPTARQLLAILEDPQKLDMYISSCQLGITIASLSLGFYGQSRMMAELAPQLARLDGRMQVIVQSVLAALILIMLTMLQVILGELIPKNVGLRYPEQLSIATAGPMAWARTLFRPLIWVLNGAARAIVRLLGVQTMNEHAHIHSPEEIMMLVEESSAGGVLDKEERRLLVNTLQLRHRTARRVMIPRNRMLAAAIDEPLTAMLSLLADSPYSRLPLYEDSIDQIVGVVHIKELLLLLHRPEAIISELGTPATETTVNPSSLRSIMHPAQFVPASTLIEDVMTQMQRHHQNLAIVIDEYGGTAGMIAFEDLVEEIIGEFQDEFDTAAPGLTLTPDNRIVASGDVNVDDLNELLGLYLPTDSVNTIGGLVINVLGKIPQAGEEVKIANIPIRVEKMEQNRVAKISIGATAAQIKQLQGPEA